MLRFENVSKSFALPVGRKLIADRITLGIPRGRSMALLGRNGAGKSSLLRLIAGTLRPDQGRIHVAGQVSWPVGFMGSFHPDLTGAQNVRFVARIYGVETAALVDFARDFSELEAQFEQPVRQYSSGMKSRLAFAMSMGIRFDTYLVDEITSVGDLAFRRKSETLLRQRLEHSGAVVVSHSMGLLRRICDCGAVLEDGRLHFFENIEAALNHYENTLLPPQRTGALPQ
ncbi:ABC transporter ATP-binding protein [Candidatus Halocynthiibacter alkanivorans]|uniref:ABC transporter ATP-binding protein n=1 Tax=Candidatus Halocynthiibacter alkanivorans TaxID=2267619 RepID=UPI000DF33AD4|nr:ABC transporter ATP-binding protein [Candidatus Halocynthiibacter alkanivorans]